MLIVMTMMIIIISFIIIVVVVAMVMVMMVRVACSAQACKKRATREVYVVRLRRRRGAGGCVVYTWRARGLHSRFAYGRHARAHVGCRAHSRHPSYHY